MIVTFGVLTCNQLIADRQLAVMLVSCISLRPKTSSDDHLMLGDRQKLLNDSKVLRNDKEALISSGAK